MIREKSAPSNIPGIFSNVMKDVSDAVEFFEILAKCSFVEETKMIKTVFSEKGNRVLMGNAPVRKIRFKAVKESIMALKCILYDLQIIGDMI